ncbi:hypothetical protein NG895_25345 [Aeoliella sp. ICT_H6.2]|uniref:DUF4381 domain-containing protein n=1 Tax=Aeoliella straminimaris TaxID=2954799 RepID=A0A9X2FHX0_9BACT|nr:hypothetical protein [Aeoliella straminimaris]MCO6047239.1 hypothetical protein [Aeoliella straminimaris]
MTTLNSTLLTWIPLANREAWQSLGDRFSGDHAKFNLGDLWALLGILLATLALVWLLNWLYRRQQARRMSNEPHHLFIDMCRAHRLSRRERNLLLQLRDELDLPMAATLFVRPDLLATENLPTDNEKDLAVYERLSTKLFAGLEALQPRQTTAAMPAVSSTATQLVVAPTTAVVSVPVQQTQ